MGFQEFPKGLCQGGAQGEWRIVTNADEEAAARAEGFASLGEHAEASDQDDAKTEAEPKPSAEAAVRKKPGPKSKSRADAGDAK